MRSAVAVVGTGRHGLRHIAAIGMVPGLRVTALCDTSAGSLQQAVDLVPDAARYHDYRTMMAEQEFDVVAVVTHGPSHADIVLAAIHAGVERIFCEKPLVTRAGDGERLVEACEANGTRLTVGLIRRFSDSYEGLIALLRQGVIGEVRHMGVTVGSGLFAAVGSHYLDLMRMVFDAEPVRATGVIDKTGRPNPRGGHLHDPGAFGTYLFQNGARGVIDIREDLGVPPKIDIVGSVGRAIIDGDEESGPDCILHRRRPEDVTESLRRYDLGLVAKSVEMEPLDLIALLANGYRQLVSDGALTCTAHDGRMVTEMLLAVHQSDSRGGAAVAIPVDDPDFEVPFT